MTLRTRMAMAVALVAAASLYGCVTDNGARKHADRDAHGPWEASFYAAGGGMTEMLGPFETREQCTQASMEHLGADDRHGRPMAFNCALMRK